MEALTTIAHGSDGILNAKFQHSHHYLFGDERSETYNADGTQKYLILIVQKGSERNVSSM